MQVSKKLTVIGIGLQLALSSSALARDPVEASAKFPQIGQCYQLEALSLEKTIPRLETLKTLPELKDLAGVLGMLKMDYQRRSTDAEVGTFFWFAANTNLSDEELTKANEEMRASCIRKIADAERAYLERGFRDLNSPSISEQQQKLLIEHVVAELTEQAKAAERQSAGGKAQ